MADYTNLEEIRLEKMAKLKELGIDPFPRRVERTHLVNEAIDLCLAAEEGYEVFEIQAALVGRFRSVRPRGKVIFANVEYGTARIQFFFR